MCLREQQASFRTLLADETKGSSRSAAQVAYTVPPVCRSLRVPAGVDTDSRLRVRGEGNAGRRGGPTGDLFVFISVKSDSGGRRSIPYSCMWYGRLQQ